MVRPNVDRTSLEKKTVMANSKSKSPNKKRREKLEATKINPWRAQPVKPSADKEEVK
jgi:hypothetical protein